MTDPSNRDFDRTQSEWTDETEREVANVPAPHNHQYRALGDGCYIRRACPHDE